MRRPELRIAESLRRFSGRCGWLVLIGVLAGVGATGCSKQARRGRFLARAEEDFKAERYDRAEIEYLGALRIPPASSVAVRRLGVLYYTEGKLPQALAYLRKGVEMQPEDVEARAKLGRVLLALQGFKEAREQALQVLGREPGNADGLLMLAATAVTTNLAQETASRLAGMPQAVKAEAAWHVARAELLLQERSLDRAEGEFKAAIAAEPRCSEAYAGLAEVEAGRGDLKGAGKELKRAVEFSPSRSGIRLSYAEFCRRTGAAETGRAVAEEITRKAPDYVPAWVFLAQSAFLEQKYAECDSLIKAVLARDPISLDGLMLKGNVMLAQGDATNAITQYERILGMGLYKNLPQVRYRLAVAQIETGATGRAAQTLNQALESDPKFADATLLLANLNIRKGDPTSAIIALKGLIKEEPQLPQAQLLLATAYLVQRNPDEAIAVYRRMGELFPHSPEAPQLLGLILAQRGDKTGARAAFEKSLEIGPHYLPALENLVDLDIEAKDYASARERVQRQKDPGSAGPWLLMAKIAMAEAIGYSPEESLAASNAPGASFHFSENAKAQTEVQQAETDLLKAIVSAAVCRIEQVSRGAGPAELVCREDQRRGGADADRNDPGAG